MRKAIICMINQRTSLKRLNTLSTDNTIGKSGAASLSESLKSNTTLTALILKSEDKRKRTHKRHPSIVTFFFLFLSTDNDIGDTGATSLSELLKSNTTLTYLDLSGEDKRQKTRMIVISQSLFLSHK